jgi:hypothetical protein
LNFNAESIIVETYYRTDFNKLQGCIKYLDDVIMYNMNIYNRKLYGTEICFDLALETLSNDRDSLIENGIVALDMESNFLNLIEKHYGLFLAIVIIIHGEVNNCHIPCFIEEGDESYDIPEFDKDKNELKNISTKVFVCSNRFMDTNNEIVNDINSHKNHYRPNLFRKNLVLKEFNFDIFGPRTFFNKTFLDENNKIAILKVLKHSCLELLENLSNDKNWLQIMNSIAENGTTIHILKSYKLQQDIDTDIYLLYDAYKLFTRKRSNIFNKLIQYINDKDNILQYDKNELGVLFYNLYNCIIKGDKHFVPDYSSESSNSYFKAFNHPTLESVFYNSNSIRIWEKYYYINKDHALYHKFIELDKPLKILNEQYNIDRPLVFTVHKGGVNYLLNETERIISSISKCCIIISNQYKELLPQIDKFLKHILRSITKDINSVIAQLGLTLEETKSLIHKFPLPSESIESLIHKVIPIISDNNDDSNIEEELFYKNINPISDDKFDNIINETNNKIIEINESYNNETNIKFKKNDIEKVEYVQNEFS